ncbi:MAG: hypothetical protein WDW38_000197 [Sanguina aurantia]
MAGQADIPVRPVVILDPTPAGDTDSVRSGDSQEIMGLSVTFNGRIPNGGCDAKEVTVAVASQTKIINLFTTQAVGGLTTLCVSAAAAAAASADAAARAAAAASAAAEAAGATAEANARADANASALASAVAEASARADAHASAIMEAVAAADARASARADASAAAFLELSTEVKEQATVILRLKHQLARTLQKIRIVQNDMSRHHTKVVSLLTQVSNQRNPVPVPNPIPGDAVPTVMVDQSLTTDDLEGRIVLRRDASTQTRTQRTPPSPPPAPPCDHGQQTHISISALRIAINQEFRFQALCHDPAVPPIQAETLMVGQRTV